MSESDQNDHERIPDPPPGQAPCVQRTATRIDGTRGLIEPQRVERKGHFSPGRRPKSAKSQTQLRCSRRDAGNLASAVRRGNAGPRIPRTTGEPFLSMVRNVSGITLRYPSGVMV